MKARLACAVSLVAALLGFARFGLADEKPLPAKIDFNRDVRPILSNHCFSCHGPDDKARKAELRLDIKEQALRELGGSGDAEKYRAIVPGDSSKSEVVRRVFLNDPDEMMPPADANKPLSDRQKEVLKRWVEQGAEYLPHWAFIPPKRAEVPKVDVSNPKSVIRNPIDAFIAARLTDEHLTMSPEADKATLIRRVTLDLTGLPPTPAEVDAFLADATPDAYERVVDRLLASPHYGERMALDWLDAARYADTHGYHIDSGRDMWRWREWVIDAFNNNKPFDQFTVEQLAGDLLPNATIEQKVASGFNRNHMINFEGGAIPEEYHAAYIIDRVNTTGTVWLGLTVGCCQCHDHKYDPITQKEFYQLYAFFHNVPEIGLDGSKGNAVPFMKAPSKEQAEQLAALQAAAAETLKRRDERAQAAAADQAAWEQQAAANAANAAPAPEGAIAHFTFDETSGDEAHDVAGKQPVAIVRGKPAWSMAKIAGGLSLDGGSFVEVGSAIAFERTDKFSYGAWVDPASKEHMAILSRMDDAQSYRGFDMFLGDGKIYVHLISRWDGNAIRVNTKKVFEPNQWMHVFATYDGSSKAEGVKIYVNGQLEPLEITHNSLKDSIQTEKSFKIGSRDPGSRFKGLIDDVWVYNRELTATEVQTLAGADPIRPILLTAADQRTPEQKEQLRKHYLEKVDASYKQLTQVATEAEKKATDFDASIPTTMVMQEMEQPRDTYLLLRGQYDKKGDKVAAATPAALSPLPPGAPPNRLGLAQWLVDPNQPLTARVIVNRYWQTFFGTGLVKTAEDFGSQGDWPSHHDLLDWLAVEFREGGWNVKNLVRLMVTSGAYRQVARVTPESHKRDPENRLLARGPRFRLPVEFIRDQALVASGLLNDKVGGKSVLPYQPAGLWEEMAHNNAATSPFSAQSYKQSTGADLYRRTMYTFWKRTVPPAALSTFDAPDRELCTVRRARTNTPLQALVLMNDPTYVEAARKLAERVLMEAKSSPEDRLTLAFRVVLTRKPSANEINVLRRVFDQQHGVFLQNPESAKQLLSVGETPRSEVLDTAELAAWTTVCSVILNLDEAVTRG